MFYKLFFSCFTMVTHFVVLMRREGEGKGDRWAGLLVSLAKY